MTEGNVAAPHNVPQAQTVISHVEGQAVIIGDNARQQISYYGDIIVRIDSLEELPPQPGEPPYKGLTYYTEADQDIFFGREQLSDDLAARLETTAFLAVAGASGSGKSSLLRAGVVPRLRRRNWLIHILTPTADPLSRLAESLTADDADLKAADKRRAELAADPQTLHQAAERLVARANAARLLLIVDQFEELFTQCHDEAGRRAFIDNLLAAARDDGRVTVLIGLRADFTGRLTEVEALRLRVEHNFALLGPMQQEDLVRVIAEPARRGGWAFVSGLVEQILSDVGQEPGRLPLLSHALLETWKERKGHVMTLSGYVKAGGVDKAIATTADNTLSRLDQQSQAVAQAIFLELTELGEGAEDTRRIARRDELMRAGDVATVEAVLNTLVTARLVVVDGERVEVAHEALIRRWPRLSGWLADNRERVRFERQMEADALVWRGLKDDPDALYRGARLAQAREWQREGNRLTPLVEAFLAVSVAEVEREAAEREREAQERIRQQEALKQEQKSAGRFRRLSRWLAAAVVIAIVTTAIASVLAVIARNALVEVERLNREVRSRRLAAEAENMLTRDPEAALLLAVAANLPSADKGASVAEARVALYHALDTPYRVSLVGHHAWLHSAAFSPDGSQVVTASTDDTARLWDPTSGKTLIVLEGHTSSVTFAGFSPNGMRLVTTSLDGHARLWDVVSGAELAVMQGHEDWVNTAAFNPNGTKVVTASNDGTARLWDGTTGKELAVLQGHENSVNTAEFSPDGTRVLTAGNDGTARMWNAISGEELVVLHGHGDRVNTAAFSPDGARVVTAGGDRTARLWDSVSGEELSVLRGHQDRVGSAVFSPDGKHVATASEDATVRLWNTADGRELVVLAGHIGGVRMVTFSPDGTKIVTASRDRTARIWEAASGDLLAELPGHTDQVGYAAFSPQGMHVLTASSDGTARVWNVASGIDLTEFVGHTDKISSLEFSPDGQRLVTSGRDGTARLWNVATGQEVALLPSYMSAKFSQDNSLLVTAGNDGLARIWDAATGEPLTRLAIMQSQVYAVAFSSDNTKVVSVSDSEVWQAWDTHSGEVMAGPIEGDSRFYEAAFSEDGALLITARIFGPTQIWDVTTGRVLVEVDAFGVQSMAFTKDGKRVVTTNDFGAAQVWDVNTGSELLRVTEHLDAVGSAAFSPDGTRLVTESDGAIQLWDVASAERLAILRADAYPVVFRPDGTQVFTSGPDGAVMIWNVLPIDLMSEAKLRPWREPTDIIPDFCPRYYQDAPDECPDTLAELFPEGN